MLYGVSFADVSKLLSKLWPAVRSNGVWLAKRVEDVGELVGNFCCVCASQICNPGVS